MLPATDQALRFNSSAFKDAFSLNPALLDIEISRMNPGIPLGRPGTAKTFVTWTTTLLTDPQTTDEAAKGIIRAAGHISKSLYPNSSTRSSFYSKIRKTMEPRWPKRSPLYQYSYKYLNLTKDESNTLATSRGLKLMISNSAVPQVKYEEVKRTVIYCSRPDATWADKVILAELSCGARISEIIQESTFTLNDSKDSITQVGIAKSKTPNKTVNKPLLFVTPPEFIELIQQIREQTAPIIMELKNNHPDMTKDDIISRLGLTVNKIVATHITSYDHEGNRIPGRLSSHDLRRIYCSIAWQTIGMKLAPMITQNAFISSILGHAASDIAAANSYTNLHVQMPELSPSHSDPI